MPDIPYVLRSPDFQVCAWPAPVCVRTDKHTFDLAQVGIASHLSLQHFNALRIPEALDSAQAGNTAGLLPNAKTHHNGFTAPALQVCEISGLGNVFGEPPKTARGPRALPIATLLLRLQCLTLLRTVSIRCRYRSRGSGSPDIIHTKFSDTEQHGTVKSTRSQRMLARIFHAFFVTQIPKSAACLQPACVRTHKHTFDLAQVGIASHLSLQHFNALRIPEALDSAQASNTAGLFRTGRTRHNGYVAPSSASL